MANNIIGFAGRARSGKSTLAQVLHNEEGYQILTIANYLKKLCCKLLGDISLTQLNELKNNDTDITNLLKIDDNFIHIINEATGIGYEVIKNELINLPYGIPTVRAMLQIVGTDIIRKYYPEWHIAQLVNEIKSLPDDVNIVVDDVRFPNERKEIERLGGIVIFIMRPTMFSMVYNHPSEISLQWFNFMEKRIIINYSNQYEFISNFLEMKANSFRRMPLKQEKYLESVKDTNHLYGLQYTDIELLNYIISNFTENNLINKPSYYPYISLTCSNSFQKTIIAMEANIKHGGENKIDIIDPFIIENLKLYL